MTASRAILLRYFLPPILLVPVVLVFLPASPVSPVSFPEVVSPFDEIDPPAVHAAAVPIPWQDDVFTGWIPSLPWGDDHSHRKVRLSRAEILKKRPAAPTIRSRNREKCPSIARDLLADSLLLGRPPPQAAPFAG